MYKQIKNIYVHIVFFYVNSYKVYYTYVLMSDNSNNTPTPEDIIAMVKCKLSLEDVPVEMQNDDYKDILTKIIKYIDKCPHNFVYDHIDINPDYSKTIHYCEYCYQYFK